MNPEFEALINERDYLLSILQQDKSESTPEAKTMRTRVEVIEKIFADYYNENKEAIDNQLIIDSSTPKSLHPDIEAEIERQLNERSIHATEMNDQKMWMIAAIGILIMLIFGRK